MVPPDTTRAHLPAAAAAPALSAPAESAVLNRSECARWLGISTRQLARLNVPCVRLGRAVRYPVRMVLRWLEETAVGR